MSKNVVKLDHTAKCLDFRTVDRTFQQISSLVVCTRH